MLFYGEEIGIGEQPALPGRLSVRAPMQWTPDDLGGFSTVRVECLVQPILADINYSFARFSVAAQRPDSGSLLNWMAALIRTRRE
jgi:maltose alpha-D-glucosyltransferase / alpha-amylase